MVVSLAGSLFFSISPDAARSKVLLYLLVSFAPFAVVAPFIGPFIDRAPGGRRFIIQLTAIGRALLFAIMIFHLDDLLLFPLSFGVLILQKTYSVSRSSLIPTVVNNKTELVEANSKLGLISGAVGALAAAPAGALGGDLAEAVVAVRHRRVRMCAVVAATKLPRGVVAQSPQPAERMELRNASLRSAAVAMSLIRAVIGFLFFELLFWLRENHYNNMWIGAVIGASTAGLMLGNGLASPLRSRLREELMLTSGDRPDGGLGPRRSDVRRCRCGHRVGRCCQHGVGHRSDGVRLDRAARRSRRQSGSRVRQVRDALSTVVGVGRGDPCAAHVPRPGRVPDRRACRRVSRLPVHASRPGRGCEDRRRRIRLAIEAYSSTSSRRATHNPGASISAAVGRALGRARSALSRASPTRSTTPATKFLPRCTW